MSTAVLSEHKFETGDAFVHMERHKVQIECVPCRKAGMAHEDGTKQEHTLKLGLSNNICWLGESGIE